VRHLPLPARAQGVRAKRDTREATRARRAIIQERHIQPTHTQPPEAPPRTTDYTDTRETQTRNAIPRRGRPLHHDPRNRNHATTRDRASTPTRHKRYKKAATSTIEHTSRHALTNSRNAKQHPHGITRNDRAWNDTCTAPLLRAYTSGARDHTHKQTKNATRNKPTGHQKHHRDANKLFTKLRTRSCESRDNSDTPHATTPTSPAPKTTRDQALTQLLWDTIRNNTRDKYRPAVTTHDTTNPHKRAHSFTETDHGQRTHAYLPAPPLRRRIQTVNTTTSGSTNDVNGRCGKRPDYQSRNPPDTTRAGARHHA
jgi:hypothetical protein